MWLYIIGKRRAEKELNIEATSVFVNMVKFKPLLDLNFYKSYLQTFCLKWSCGEIICSVVDKDLHFWTNIYYYLVYYIFDYFCDLLYYTECYTMLLIYWKSLALSLFLRKHPVVVSVFLVVLHYYKVLCNFFFFLCLSFCWVQLYCGKHLSNWFHRVLFAVTLSVYQQLGHSLQWWIETCWRWIPPRYTTAWHRVWCKECWFTVALYHHMAHITHSLWPRWQPCYRILGGRRLQ